MDRDIAWGWISLAVLALVALVVIEMWMRKERFLPNRRRRRRRGSRGFGRMKSNAQLVRERSEKGPAKAEPAEPKPSFKDRVSDDGFRAGRVSRRPRTPRKW